MGRILQGAKLSSWRSSVWLRLIKIPVCLFLINTFAIGTAPIPSGKPASYPDWWFEQEVIPLRDATSGTQPSWNADYYQMPDDYSAANIGQLKFFAIKAAAELNAHLPGGAGDQVNALIAQWAAPASDGTVRDDYAMVNIGQIKAVAQLFYDQLISAHYTNDYPWSISNLNVDDYAAANLGQLKYIFSFDLTYSTLNDGVPDWWKLAAGLSVSDPAAITSPTGNTTLFQDGQSITYQEAYQQGFDPITAATADPQNNPPPGKGNPLLEFDTLTYVAVDASSAYTQEDVNLVAIDDSGRLGFEYGTTESGTYYGASFYQGQVTLTDSLPSSFGPIDIGFGDSEGVLRYVEAVNASGHLVGMDDWGDGEFFAVDVSGSQFGTGPSDPWIFGDIFVYYSLSVGNSGLIMGSIGQTYAFQGNYNASDWYSLSLLYSLYGYLQNLPNTFFTPYIFSPGGTGAGGYGQYNSASGYDSYAVGTYANYTPIVGKIAPYAVSDNGLVVGDNEAVADDSDTLTIWDGRSTRRLSSLLPSAYATKIRFPRSGAEVWINSNSDIVVSAEVLNENVPNKLTWVPRMLLWRNALSGSSIPSFVTFPDRVIRRWQFNSNAVFAATIYNADGDHVAAAELIPTEFREEYPSSGFDGVSQPPWLMVPVNGSNQADAITSASSASTLSFSIKPASTATTVQPTSTNDSIETITVASSEISSTSSVQVGIGNSTATDPAQYGLHIDVKPKKPISIAIHAVTQHYTAPMVLPKGMAGTPGTVCVQGAHSLYTTPVAPDHYGRDGSLTIVTGSDGVCHTTAASGDSQVIPVGQGIPADITPADTPTEANLKDYLNQVYGQQANVYFTVTRSDFTCNYDSMTPINGTLDISEGQGTRPSSEQAVIEAHASSGVTFNIFYVKDYQGLTLPGKPADHSSIGIAYFPRHIAYVRDYPGSSVVVDCTAHEIGHLLNLGHTNDDRLPSGKPNPASVTNVPDRAPKERLMYPIVSGSNTFLIKPEWDIINPNNPPTP